MFFQSMKHDTQKASEKAGDEANKNLTRQQQKEQAAAAQAAVDQARLAQSLVRTQIAQLKISDEGNRFLPQSLARMNDFLRLRRVSLLLQFGGIMVERVENWPFAKNVLSFSVRDIRKRIVRAVSVKDIQKHTSPLKHRRARRFATGAAACVPNVVGKTSSGGGGVTGANTSSKSGALFSAQMSNLSPSEDEPVKAEEEVMERYNTVLNGMWDRSPIDQIGRAHV